MILYYMILNSDLFSVLILYQWHSLKERSKRDTKYTKEEDGSIYYLVLCLGHLWGAKRINQVMRKQKQISTFIGEINYNKMGWCG